MAAAAASPLARITSLHLQHEVDLLQRNDSVLSWKPGSDRILCHHNLGRKPNSTGSSDSSTDSPIQRRKHLNMDSIRGETSAEQKPFMFQGMYKQQEQQVESPWYPVLRLLQNVVHGVTNNSTILEKAVTISGPYNDRYRNLMQEGCVGVEDAYWDLVVADVREACDMFLPIYHNTRGQDGYVSVEVAPYLARDGVQTLEATRLLHERVARPNVYIGIPSTQECLPAMKGAISMGISVNSMHIFSLERYEAVAEGYLQGLEAVDPRTDLSHISGVACFSVSRVDAHANQKLEALGSEEALNCRGKSASAMAALVFELYRQKFSGPRWEALERRGAKRQKLLWASTMDQNPAYPDTLYVVPLPDAVNAVPATPREAFLKHVNTADNQDYRPCEEGRRVYERIQELGVCWSDVAQFLEQEGIRAFQDCFENALTALVKADLEDLFSK